jgi:uncharacterized protein (TIGR03437 family)
MITPTKAGYTFTPVNRSVTISSANLTAINFTATLQTWTISGSLGTAGSGASVVLAGTSTSTATADASGNFTFSGLVNGSYTVTPSKPGYTFSPVSQAVTISGANQTAINLTATAITSPITVDVTATGDCAVACANVDSAPFSTAYPNELILAFVATGYVSGMNTTVSRVSGGGLRWALVGRANTQSGTSEIWRALATTTVSNVIVSALMSQSVQASITVMTFTGIDTSGTYGSGAIGAFLGASALSGSPSSATITTTRNLSLVYGVGNTPGVAASRSVGPSQSLIRQQLASSPDTFWFQRGAFPVLTTGTAVTLNSTGSIAAPSNFIMCEILASPALLPAAAPTQSSGTSSGTTLITAASAPKATAAAVTDDAAESTSQTTEPTLQLVNPASGVDQAACTPGGLAALRGGQGFTTGTRVLVNGQDSPVFGVTSSTLNFQCPVLPVGSDLEISVESATGPRQSLRSAMKESAPGLFAPNSDGSGGVVAARTGEVVGTRSSNPSTLRPVVSGETLVMYATGLGDASTSRLRVFFGGLEVEPLSVKSVAGSPGLFEVHLNVPYAGQEDAQDRNGFESPIYLVVTDKDGQRHASNAIRVAVTPVAEVN